MKNLITRFLSPPTFEDEDKTRIANLINGVLLVIVIGAVLFLIFSRVAWEADWLIASLSLITLLTSVILKILLNRGYVQIVGIWLSLVLWTIITIPVYVFDGIRDAATTGYFLVIAIAGLVLGGRILFLFTILSSLSYVVAFWAEVSDLLVTSFAIPPSPIDLVTVLLSLNLTALLIGLLVRRIIMNEKLTRVERNKAQKYLDIAGTIIIALDSDQNVMLVNERGCEVLGYEQIEMIGKNWFDHFLPAGIKEQVRADFTKFLVSKVKAFEHYENAIVTKSGKKRLITWHNTILKDDGGKVIGILSSGEDITERKQAEREIKKRRLYLEGVLGAAPDAIVTMDANHQIVEWNKGAESLFGYSQEEVIGQGIDDLIANPDMSHEAIDFTRRVMRGEKIPPTETVRYRKDRSAVDVLLAGSPILVEGEFVGAVAVYTDISERKQMEQQLAHLATHDPLTNLPNRTLFQDRMEHALQRSARHNNQRVEKWEIAVVVIDLDNFKVINDTLGHAAGDLLLQAIAKRLQAKFRDSDSVARMGGDEFTILFENITGKRDAIILAEKVLKIFSQPFDLDGHVVAVEASIGLSQYPQDGRDFQILFKHADEAMYAAKNSRNTYCFFSDLMDE